MGRYMKLSVEQVHELIKDVSIYPKGKRSASLYKYISKKYGVSKNLVYNILSGEDPKYIHYLSAYKINVSEATSITFDVVKKYFIDYNHEHTKVKVRKSSEGITVVIHMRKDIKDKKQTYFYQLNTAFFNDKENFRKVTEKYVIELKNRGVYQKYNAINNSF